MPDEQTEFKSFARVEVMGHSEHIGFVQTVTYGQSVFFRVDRPELPEVEETLTEREWTGSQYLQPGSIVRRGKIEAVSVLLGSHAIFRITPCDEATVLAAIRQRVRRPLMLVKMAELRAIESPMDESDDVDEDDSNDLFDQSMDRVTGDPV